MPRPPEADAADRRRLEEADAALGLGLTSPQIDGLLRYRDALLHWNRVYNLTALRDPDEALRQHLVDCLAVVPAFRRAMRAIGQGRADSPGATSETGARSGARELLDVGSGGGLPGLIVAIAEPGWRIDCIDAVGKKVAFIRQMAAELGLGQVRAVHARVEDWLRAPDTPRYAIVTSRAFAALGDFVAATAGAPSADGGLWAAMKGVRPDAEIAALPAGVRMFHVEPLEAADPGQQRCLIWMCRADADPTIATGGTGMPPAASATEAST